MACQSYLAPSRSLTNEGRDGDRELDDLIRQRDERERENRELKERIRQRTQNLAHARSRSRSPAAPPRGTSERNPRSGRGCEHGRSTRSRTRHQEDEALLPEEEHEIIEDGEADDDQVIDQDFYNKFFKMLRQMKSDKWSIRLVIGLVRVKYMLMISTLQRQVHPSWSALQNRPPRASHSWTVRRHGGCHDHWHGLA